MMRRWIGLCLFGIWLTAGVAAAQTTSSTTTQPAATTQSASTTSSTGAFNQLSPGNQKIAQSLFAAQNPPSGTTALTLDQIAALKQGGKGWGEVFKEMKAQGLVQQKNLGQVVSAYSRQHRPSSPSSKAAGTSTSGRSSGVSTKDKSDGAGARGDTDRGAGLGSGVTDGSSHGSAFGRGGAEMGSGSSHSGGAGGGRGK